MKKNSFLAKFYMFMVFFFLFAPIVVMILFSFNAGKSTSVFEGFSLKWYLEMITNEAILEAVRNTLLLAVTSSVISTMLGTIAAYGINKMRSPGVRTMLMTVTQIPMILSWLVFLNSLSGGEQVCFLYKKFLKKCHSFALKNENVVLL